MIQLKMVNVANGHSKHTSKHTFNKQNCKCTNLLLYWIFFISTQCCNSAFCSLISSVKIVDNIYFHYFLLFILKAKNKSFLFRFWFLFFAFKLRKKNPSQNLSVKQVKMIIIDFKKMKETSNKIGHKERDSKKNCFAATKKREKYNLLYQMMGEESKNKSHENE